MLETVGNLNDDSEQTSHRNYGSPLTSPAWHSCPGGEPERLGGPGKEEASEGRNMEDVCLEEGCKVCFGKKEASYRANT